jgi:prophage antirepressor-like protein
VAKKRSFVQRLLGRDWVDPEEKPPTPTKPSSPDSEPVSILWEGYPLEYQLVDGELLFAGISVCRAAGIVNVSDALSRLDDGDKRDGLGTTDTIGRKQLRTWINMAGFFTLVLTSRKDEAKALKRFVTHDLLPSIQKHGCYPPPGQEATDQTPIRSWIGKRAKKCGFPRSWMKKRQRAADGNKAIAAQTFAMGGDAMACAKRFIALHLGLTGKTTQEHREMLGMRSKDSPLDQWAETPVALYEAALSLSCKQAEEGLIAVDDLPAAAQLQGEVQWKAAIDALPGYDFAPVENRKGYKVLDLIKKLPSP